MHNNKSDAESNLRAHAHNPDLIVIDAYLREHQAGNEQEKVYTITAHKSRSVRDIWDRIAASLEKDKIANQSFQLLFDQTTLRKS